MTHFSLVSDCHLEAPLERVWELIETTEDWPLWWRAVKRIEAIGESRWLGHCPPPYLSGRTPL